MSLSGGHKDALCNKFQMHIIGQNSMAVCTNMVVSQDQQEARSTTHSRGLISRPLSLKQNTRWTFLSYTYVDSRVQIKLKCRHYMYRAKVWTAAVGQLCGGVAYTNKIQSSFHCNPQMHIQQSHVKNWWHRQGDNTSIETMSYSHQSQLLAQHHHYLWHYTSL